MILCLLLIANNMINNPLSRITIDGFYLILNAAYYCDYLFISLTDRTFLIFVPKYAFLEI